MKIFSLTNIKLFKSVCLSMFCDFPMFCRLELTSKCNFRCEFCHIHRHCGEHEDLSLKRILAIIDSLAYAGTSVLYLTGGEPLMREDISDILKYIKRKNIYIILGTNGSLFKQKFKDISGYVDNVHFSLQSENVFESITGAGKEVFQNIVDGIKLAVKQNIPVQINVTVDKNNIDEMEKTAGFINKETGVNIAFSPMTLMSPYEKDNKEMKHLLPDIKIFYEKVSDIRKKIKNVNVFDIFIEKMRRKYFMSGKFFCKAGRKIISVNSSGELVFPCEFISRKKIFIENRCDVKTFLKETNKINFCKDFTKDICRSCTDGCYMQPSYFISFEGFFITLKNILFSI